MADRRVRRGPVKGNWVSTVKPVEKFVEDSLDRPEKYSNSSLANPQSVLIHNTNPYFSTTSALVGSFAEPGFQVSLITIDSESFPQSVVNVK